MRLSFRLLFLSDINECANGSIHNCAQQCTNTPGSFVCSCNAGFTLNSNKYSCDGEKSFVICTTVWIKKLLSSTYTDRETRPFTMFTKTIMHYEATKHKKFKQMSLYTTQFAVLKLQITIRRHLRNTTKKWKRKIKVQLYRDNITCKFP